VVVCRSCSPDSEGYGAKGAFDQVLPYFKRAETNTRGANEWHGNGGPITVKPSQVDLPICEAFLAAAGKAGFSVVDDLNADVSEGFGRFDTNIANGRRASTAVAYVQPARRRGNLELALSGYRGCGSPTLRSCRLR
jgi:choline dehydrogenase